MFPGDLYGLEFGTFTEGAPDVGFGSISTRGPEIPGQAAKFQNQNKNKQSKQNMFVQTGCQLSLVVKHTAIFQMQVTLMARS